MSKIVISHVSLVNKKSSFIWTVKRGFSSIYIERDSIMNVDSMRWCCCAKVKPLQWVKHVTAKKRDFHYTRRRFSIIIFSCCCCFYRETLDKLMHWNGIRRRGLTFHLIDTKKRSSNETSIIGSTFNLFRLHFLIKMHKMLRNTESAQTREKTSADFQYFNEFYANKMKWKSE